MDDWIWGYLLGRKKERRRQAQELVGMRYQMEQEIRARNGLPLLPGPAVVPPTWRATRSRPVPVVPASRLMRRVVLWTLVLALVLVLLFLAYCIVYGVQHHLIYPAPSP
jgi:hypothetical protein